MSIEVVEESSILILADGRILARNVTPAIAAALLALRPDNAELALRAGTSIEKATSSSNTP
jgi:hypothetical protein